MSLIDRWRARADDARRIKGDPPPTYAQLEATVATLTVLTKQQGSIIRNLRSQVDSLMVENAQLRAAELGVVAAESKPGGGKLDREMPRLELDPSPTRLYVLPQSGGDDTVWTKEADDASWLEFDQRAKRREDR